ncbi:MAG: DUF1565 domain-containing protein [Planctomycetota bacterium]
MPRLVVSVLRSLLPLVLALPALATTWHVAPGGSPFATGTLANPFATIQRGIDVSQAGDIVLVAPGTYLENINFKGKAVIVRGAQGAAVTIIDGGLVDCCVLMVSGEGTATKLDGFTLQNGKGLNAPANQMTLPFTQSNSRGGGIHMEFASARIERCVIRNCQGGRDTSTISGQHASGGAMQILGGVPLVTDCVFEQNLGGLGASDPAVAGDGGPGAVFLRQSSAAFVNCIFRDNQGGGGGFGQSGGRGGAGGVSCYSIPCAPGVSISPNAPAFVGCFFHDNTGGAGGPGDPTLGGDGGAGALQALASAPVLYNETIVRNHGGMGDTVNFGANGVGGVQSLDACAVVALTSCILRDNLGPTGSLSNRNGVVTLASCNSQGIQLANGNIDADPKFRDAANDDFRLRADSPCIDAGLDAIAGIVPTDFEFEPRLIGRHVEIGADEFCLAGSLEDLGMSIALNSGSPSPLCRRNVAVGDLVQAAITSPGGTFAFAPVYLLAQFWSPLAPLSQAGFPELHVNTAGFTILTQFGLPPGGAVPAGVADASLTGTTLRLQAVAISPLAANGFFASSPAFDLVIN